MDRQKFEDTIQKAFDALPPKFRDNVENVEIVVEDYPRTDRDSGSTLLGLYHGIPLTKRGVWYGTTPVLPDRITLYQKNIERLCTSEEEIAKKIYEVLFHEIGHYFGMNEKEIRSAMREWN